MEKKKTREMLLKCLKFIWTLTGIFLFLMMPVVSYRLFEYVTGNLRQISPDMEVLNIFWIFLLYLAVFSFSGTSRVAVPVVSAFLAIASIAEAFVEEFRGTPIMVWDVLAFKTAMTVADNYVFRISEEMINAVFVLLNLNFLLQFFPVHVKGWKKRLALGGFGTCAVAGLAACFYMVIVPSRNLEINMWSMNDTYENSGYILSTAISLKYVVKKPPRGYSLALLREYAEEYGKDREEEIRYQAFSGCGEESGEKIRPVNLICIMNESLSDLKVAGEFTTNREYFPFLNRLEENTVKGSLCVPVFGAMTSNSEFEFLLGDSMAMLPSGSIAYQFYVKEGVRSLVSTVKDQGYEAVAMHPYPGSNWNRDVCYQNMGFDRFLEWESFYGSQVVRNYVSDLGDFQKIIETVEQKKHPDDKLFVFNVTMQNHGGYEAVYENFLNEVWLTGENFGKYPKTDQYLSLMKVSDEAFAYLLDYFKESSQPTMIVMFGDHQPGVEDEFYDQIAGRPSSQVQDPERLMWYQTPFVIWTNYPQPSRNMERLGAVYLSAHVLSLANLEMTPYHRFLLRMSESLPVIHPIGVYQQDGTYYSWAEAESESCPYQDLVLKYESMVFNHSLDSRTVEELFSLPPGDGS